MTKTETKIEIKTEPDTVPAGQTEVSSGSICHARFHRMAGNETAQLASPLLQNAI